MDLNLNFLTEMMRAVFVLFLRALGDNADRIDEIIFGAKPELRGDEDVERAVADLKAAGDDDARAERYAALKTVVDQKGHSFAEIDRALYNEFSVTV